MSKPFRLEDHRWELCKVFLERADKSGELLRALLFAAGSAGVALALQQIAGISALPLSHVISVTTT
jgi:hypothetical protein